MDFINVKFPWFSLKIIVASSCGKPKSYSNFQSHMASLVANEVAMYSTFVDERATVGCFLLTQHTAPFANTNANLVVDLLKFKPPPQFEFKKPLKVIPSSSPQYCSHKSCVP
jgi:hypothetical protein